MPAAVPRPADYADERQLLAQRIQLLFPRVRGFRDPDIEDCIRIAYHVERVRSGDAKDDERSHSLRQHSLRMVKHGRALLRELAAVQGLLTGDEAEKAQVSKEEIQKLLYEGAALFNSIHYDEIFVFAGLAKDAWGRANGKFPRSTEWNAPLCKFVVAVIAEAGIHVSPATVSAVLQGKRQRRGQ